VIRTSRLTPSSIDVIPDSVKEGMARRIRDLAGLALIGVALLLALALATWNVRDPSLSNAAGATQRVSNLLGYPGAVAADLFMQLFGIGSVAFLLALGLVGAKIMMLPSQKGGWKLNSVLTVISVLAGATLASALPVAKAWPLPTGLGGAIGDGTLGLLGWLGIGIDGLARVFAVLISAGTMALVVVFLTRGFAEKAAVAEGDDDDEQDDEPNAAILSLGFLMHWFYAARGFLGRLAARRAVAGRASLADRARGWFRRTPRVERSAVPQPRREPVLGPVPAPPRVQATDFVPQSLPPRVHDPDDDEPPFEIPVQTPPLPRIAQAEPDMLPEPPAGAARVAAPVGALKPGKREAREQQVSIFDHQEYQFPPLALLAEPKRAAVPSVSTDALEQNARLLEGVLDDFGVRGEIINVRPGPVVTLYELEPAPGTKSSRVIGLAEDIARSMSAVAARVAVVQGRNAIGIELPNQKRETVLLRELLACEDFEKSKLKLAICLGKTIGGEPVIVDLARMPHLLVAGTTGSGKSVAINTMICSLLYRLQPEDCRLIMIDPKMLELSVYDGIPHLLTPVVTDPKKAVVALKWAVREMEDRYRKMSKVGVRNIDGYNQRIAEALEKGEVITRTIQTGYDRETGEAIYEEEVMGLEKLPYIVVIVDEMADLMLVAGKEIEGAVQRLAQMARAAGIHIIMATQRPSVDVITGTIKANFPTRISFQVTSKIDSRTILGEMGAEQLLGQGDMLYMAGGGRISRVHGPFVADGEVEKIVAHLKTQGRPDYIEAVTADPEGEAGDGAAAENDDGAVFDKGNFGEEPADLYDQAVQVVLRDKKASTSYVQRRLQIGYNRAASIIERMEREGIVGPANHAGKREILLPGFQSSDG
jgi:S-DNA-T family DNA segregation ATPase FtsK/SpoIIIE